MSQLFRGSGPVVALAQDFGEADVHVGDAAQRAGPVLGDQLQTLFVEALRVAESTLGNADIGHRNGTAEDVGDVADAPHAGDRNGVLGEGSVEVALGPSCEPEQCVRGRLAHLVVGRSEISARDERGRRFRPVAARQRQCGAVHLDRARQGRSCTSSTTIIPAAIARCRCECQPLLDVSQAGFERSTAPSDIMAPTKPMARTGRRARSPPGRAAPTRGSSVLAVAAHLRQRQLGELGGLVEVARGKCVRDGGRGLAVLGVPGAGPPVQRNRGIRIFFEETRAEYVGEEVVIPIPLAPIVERNDEQVLPIQCFECRLASGCPRHRVAQRSLEPVEDGRLQHEAPHGFGLAVQHLAREVVDDETVVTGETGDEARDVLPALHGKRRELQRGDPAFGPRFQGCDIGCRQVEAHRTVQVFSGFLRR